MRIVDSIPDCTHESTVFVLVLARLGNVLSTGSPQREREGVLAEVLYRILCKCKLQECKCLYTRLSASSDVDNIQPNRPKIENINCFYHCSEQSSTAASNKHHSRPQDAAAAAAAAASHVRGPCRGTGLGARNSVFFVFVHHFAPREGVFRIVDFGTDVVLCCANRNRSVLSNVGVVMLE